MKLRAIAALSACWLALTGTSPPRLPVLTEELLAQGGPASLPSLPYRLEGLEGPVPTPEELAAGAEAMLHAGRFDEAKPLLSTLARYPDFALHTAFMEGYLAIKQGEFAAAAERLQQAVEISPDYTRARVELGQALMELGQLQEADRQFEIAERDRTLPPDVLEIVKVGRRRTAERARWHLDVDAGILADTQLDAPAQMGGRREGIGTSVGASGGVRVRAGDRTSIAVEAEAYWNHFDGGTPDEASVLVAAGPEVRFPDGVATVQITAFERWYGDRVSSRGAGFRGRYQQRVDEGQRIYLLVDARIFETDFGDDFAGTQASAYLIYENVLDPGLSINATLYGRREWLGSDIFSNTEGGLYVGAAARLPLGLRSSVSFGAVRALYDDPFLRFSTEPRHDWRLSGSLYLGLREALPGNLWPTLSYHYISTDSSLYIYDNDRHRVRFNVRRPF